MHRKGKWHSLTHASAFPTLLVKANFNEAGYEIYLTDLSRVWSEKLDHTEIVQRALNCRCSIEASENDQYQVLLEKIQSALNNEAETTVQFNAGSDSSMIEAIVTAPLPEPLPALVWTIQLARAVDSSIGAEFVQPLLHQASGLQDQVKQLISEIRAKDRVISKIADRLETTRNDLATVFPGVSGIKTARKENQRAQLAQYVHGLGDFDEDEWRAQLAHRRQNENLSRTVIDSIFENMPDAELKGDVFEDGPSWWQHLCDNTTKGQHDVRAVETENGLAVRRSMNPTSGPGTTLKEENSVPDDSFQRQSTPPLRGESQRPPLLAKHGSNKLVNLTNDQGPHISQQDDDSTADEDDLDMPTERKASSEQESSPHVQIPASQPIPAGKRKLGAFGGQKANKTLEPPESEGTEKVSQQQTSSLFRSRGSQQLANTKSSFSEPNQINETQPSYPARPKLGRLGGKIEPDRELNRSSDERATLKDKRDAQDSKTVEKRAIKDAEVSPAPSEVRTSGSVEIASDKFESEDPEERANRRRDQLKRVLNDQSKTTTKKKRKF